MSLRDSLRGQLDNLFDDGWQPKQYDDVPVTHATHIMVTADAHVPKHDPALFAEVLAQAVEEGIEELVHAGDLMDMEEFSRFGIDDQTSSFGRNIKATGKLLRLIADTGVHQWWTMGNHEQRLFRALPQLNMRLLASMAGVDDLIDAGKLSVSDSTVLHASVGNWMIVHPAAYGSTPGVVPGKLATRFQRNVISGHEHHWGMGMDETGQFYHVSTGGMFDSRLHKYYNMNITGHRTWVSGYVTLHRGRPMLYRGDIAKQALVPEFA